MAQRLSWAEVLSHELLTEAGSGSRNLEQMADRMASLTGLAVTKHALFNGYKRHREKLRLPPSIRGYLDEKSVDPPDLKQIQFPLGAQRKRAFKKTKRWVVTCAVNNVEIDPVAWKSLTRYAQKHAAEIVVIPIRYKNPTTRRHPDAFDDDEDYWWDRNVSEYLCDELVDLGGRWVIAGHVRIGATANNPLRSMKSISRGSSAIFGHPQLAMETVATPQHAEAKVITTSMAITQPVYSTTKEGVRGEFHHSIGAVVVERDRHGHYYRQLVCDDDGGFHDVAGGELRYYGPRSDRKAKAESMSVSDEHVPFTERKNEVATYTALDSISNVCRPKYTVRHDAVDMYAINRHERKNLIKALAGHQFGFCSLADELQAGVDYVDRTTAKFTQNVFPWSNHPNEHLLNWLSTNVLKDEPWNARIWHKLWGRVIETLAKSPDGYTHDDPFSWWMKENVSVPATFLGPDESFVVAGIDLGFHGHQGPGGARGTRRNMSTVGVRTIIGHGHSPGIHQGCWQVGTMTRNLKYAKGPSAWACCQVLSFSNGKRQAVFINDDGRWYAKS